MSRRVKGWLDDGRTYGWVEGWLDGWMGEGWFHDGRMNGWMGERMVG